MKNIIFLQVNEHNTWFWWLLLSALAFALGMLVSRWLFSDKKKIQALESENEALNARNSNWEKDYASLKYQLEQKDFTEKTD